MPRIIAEKLGQIQDTHKLTGGDMPVYHGAKFVGEGKQLPDFRTTELLRHGDDVLEKIVNKRNKLDQDYLNLANAGRNKNRVYLSGWPVSKEEAVMGVPIPTRQEILDDPDYQKFQRLEKIIDKLHDAEQNQVLPSLFDYFDPAAAGEFAETGVVESIMDMSNHGYHDWDIKGLLGQYGRTDPEGYKQMIYDKMRDRSGAVLDPVDYREAFKEKLANLQQFEAEGHQINRMMPRIKAERLPDGSIISNAAFNEEQRRLLDADKIRRKIEQPTYPSAPSEDHVPQIMTWDPSTPRRMRGIYDPEGDWAGVDTWEHDNPMSLLGPLTEPRIRKSIPDRIRERWFDTAVGTGF